MSAWPRALLESDATADEKVLCEGGFQRLSELLYLVSPDSEFPTSRPVSPLEFEPYSPANHRRLAEIVQATYQQTRDCPQLNGVRDVEDVLAGYRAAGVFDSGRWLIVRHAGSDVGCLLLTDFPEHDNWELTYMGVTPSARGNGWGIEIVRHGPMAGPSGGPFAVGLGGGCRQRTGHSHCTRRRVFRPGTGGRSA